MGPFPARQYRPGRNWLTFLLLAWKLTSDVLSVDKHKTSYVAYKRQHQWPDRIICEIPNPSIPSNPRNTICQTKLLFWSTYAHRFLPSSMTSCCSHTDPPPLPFLPSLFPPSLLFSSPPHYYFPSSAAAPPSRGNPLWLVATDTTRTRTCLLVF